MSIKYYDKNQSTPSEVFLAGTPQTDLILNNTSKNPIANKTVYNALADKIEATVTNLVNFYNKSQVYTKTEVRDLIGAIESMTMEVVNALPSSDISTTTIYLLKQSGSNNYDQYVYINNEWVKIGTTAIDLSGYVTSSQLTLAISDFLTETEINLLLADKQDKALSSSVTIGAETVGTVEDAIGEVADLVPSTATSSNKLATQADLENVEIDVDSALSSSSENPVQNKVIKAALDDKQDNIFEGTLAQWQALPSATKAEYSLVVITDDADYVGNIVDSVTDGEMSAVTSNAVYDAIAEKQDTLVPGTNIQIAADGKTISATDTTTGTTYAANNVPSNTTFATNGSVANVRNMAKSYLPIFGTVSGRGTIADALHIDTANVYGTANQVGYVYSGGSTSIPSDCAFGIREVFYYNSTAIMIQITGVDASGYFAIWGNAYVNGTWGGWKKQ